MSRARFSTASSRMWIAGSLVDGSITGSSRTGSFAAGATCLAIFGTGLDNSGGTAGVGAQGSGLASPHRRGPLSAPLDRLSDATTMALPTLCVPLRLSSSRAPSSGTATIAGALATTGVSRSLRSDPRASLLKNTRSLMGIGVSPSPLAAIAAGASMAATTNPAARTRTTDRVKRITPSPRFKCSCFDGRRPVDARCVQASRRPTGAYERASRCGSCVAGHERNAGFTVRCHAAPCRGCGIKTQQFPLLLMSNEDMT